MMASTLAVSGRAMARSAALSSAPPSCTACPITAGASRSATSRAASSRRKNRAARSDATSASAAKAMAAAVRLEARTASSLLSMSGVGCGLGASRHSSSAIEPSVAGTKLPPPAMTVCGQASSVSPFCQIVSSSTLPAIRCITTRVSSTVTSVVNGGVCAGAAGAVDWTKAEFATATLLALSAAGMFVAGASATGCEGVRFAGPAPFVGVKAKLGGGGDSGGSIGPSGSMASQVTQGAGLLSEDTPKEDSRAIEFEVAGRRVRLLGNPTVTQDWIGPSVSKSRAKVEPLIPKAYDVSIRALKGGRLSMEDEYFVGNGGRFVAVFDGHGGGGVSQYLRDKLYDVFGRHLREAEDGCIDDNSLFHRGGSKDRLTNMHTATSPRACSITSRVAAMRAAFEEIDRDVLLNDDLQYQGSTAVAVALHEEPDGTRTLVSANVGDSRAVLSRRGRAVDLTRDHKPNDEKEKSRILAMGEKIEWDHYCKVHRVRNLSLSRAIGDRFAKPAVSGEVEIKRFPIAEDGDEFIMLASDGIWDVMSSQEVVSFVHDKLSVPLKIQGDTEDMERVLFTRRKNMSRFLANEAIRRGTGDNVCVVIVWLKDCHFDVIGQ